MRLRRCPGGVKGSTLSRHVRGLGIDSRVRTLFLLIFVVFTLCVPCYSSLLSACTVKRGAPLTASCLIHTNLNRTSPASITP